MANVTMPILLMAALQSAAFMLALTLCSTLLFADEADEAPEFGVLFVAPGVEETYGFCTPCHSERLVAQQGLTRNRWAKIFDQMVEEYDMEVIEEPYYTIILDYLEMHYGPDRPHFQIN